MSDMDRDPCVSRRATRLLWALAAATVLVAVSCREVQAQETPRLDLVVEVSTWAPACRLRLPREVQQRLMEDAQVEADRLDRELGREAAADHIDAMFRRADEERGRSRDHYPAARCQALRRRLGEGLQLAARP